MRKHSIDLLKVILVFMILTLHYNHYHIGNGFISNNTYLGLFKFFIESLFICASNVFVIIYGYNNIDKNNSLKKNIIKILKIYGVVIIYGFILSLIYYFLSNKEVSLELFKTNFISRFFINNYCLIVLISPLLNKVFTKINKKISLFIITILSLVFFIIDTFIYDLPIINAGYDIFNFIILYLIGGYIKQHNKKISILFGFIIYIICGVILLSLFGLNYEWTYYYNNPIVIIESIALFNIFIDINIKENKFITKLSSYSLAVYVIHTMDGVLKVLYLQVFKTNIYCKDINVIWNYPLTIISIFVGCIIIEYLRRKSRDGLVLLFNNFNKFHKK